MAIPDFQSFLLPVLRLASTRNVRTKDSLDAISDEFDLTDEERDILLPSGKRTVVASRLSWALHYLAKAGMLESRVRGVYSITPKGKELLNRGIEKLPPSFYEKSRLNSPPTIWGNGRVPRLPATITETIPILEIWRKVRKRR